MSTLPNSAQAPAPASPMDLLASSRPAANRVADGPDFAERLDRERPTDRADRTDRPERAERSDRPDRPDRAEARERSERPSARDADSRTDASAEARSRDDSAPASDRPDQEVAATDAGAQAQDSQTDQAPDQLDNGSTQADSDAGAETQTATQDADATASVLDIIEALKAETSEQAGGLSLIGLSGETIQLAQPTAPLTGVSEPGELGRWFTEAAGPVIQTAQAGTAARQAGLLNNLPGSQTGTPGALTGDGLPSGLLGADGQPIQPGTGSSATGEVTAQSGETPDFADMLARSNAKTETLDQFAAQMMAKTSTADMVAQPTQTLMTGQSMAASSQSMATAAPTSATGQAVPVTALAVEITRQAMNGKTQFDIRLDPPELGRLNVRLEMDASGQTRTHLVVERAETLDMLTTDARNLERALQQAGLKAEPGSVSFELAQDSQDGLGQNSDQTNTNDTASQNSGDGSPGTSGLGMEDEALPVSAEAMRYQVNVTGHLDVRV